MEAFYTLEFTTYLSRFLLNFDADCAAWWETRMAAIPASLPPDKQTSRRNAAFGAFSASVEYGLRRYPGASGPKALLRSLERQHGSDPEACRHLALAFTFLDERSQPRDDIARLVRRVTAGESGATGTGGSVTAIVPPAFSPGLPDYLWQDPTALLPSTQLPVRTRSGLYEVRGLAPFLLDGRPTLAPPPAAGQRIARTTVFGPRGDVAGEERALRLADFALFALAGCAGCAGTHSAVIPLDVVKTRLQTAPGRYASLQAAFGDILREEGAEGLLLGAAPTLLGYAYYGATVYPGFEFFRRTFDLQLGPALAASLHAPVVLLSGACATVVACLGVCPAEVVRIRMVSRPEAYGGGSDLGGALAALRAEAEAAGAPLRSLLYSGFRPLVLRQVIFGMIKFFTFDFVVEAVLEVAPQLAESAQTELLLSLGAGLVAGVASSLISQPADTILSRMNRGAAAAATVSSASTAAAAATAATAATAAPRAAASAAAVARVPPPPPPPSPGLLRSAREIVGEYGVGGFYLGAGARCVWSGAIIAGQFFFYDLARQLLNVAADDLLVVLDVNL